MVRISTTPHCADGSNQSNNHWNYILVTAHPDDESMFFLPTLYGLVHDHASSSPPSIPTQLHILCLSNGNYNQLGAVRQKELLDAVSILSDKIQVTIIHHEQLQDSPNESWPSEVICDVLRQYITQSGMEKAALMTFDEYGVSGHKNHMDTWKGVWEFYKMHDSSKLDLELWTLYSVRNVLCKYLPLWDVLLSIFALCSNVICRVGRRCITTSSSSSSSSSSTSYCFRMMNPLLAWRTMNAHYSQFVWYRKLFVIFSRYSYVNDWTIHTRQLNIDQKKKN